MAMECPVIAAISGTEQFDSGSRVDLELFVHTQDDGKLGGRNRDRPHRRPCHEIGGGDSFNVRSGEDANLRLAFHA